MASLVRGGDGGGEGGGGGQAAVRLIEHILINSISPPCNRPHGYLLARAPEKHAMGAIPRETETVAYLGDARARADARERDEQRDDHVYVHVYMSRCVSGSVRTCKKEGTVWWCVEPEVRADSRTAGASVRQRRHRFGLHAPIIGRLIGRYSATDSALHRFRVARPRNHTRFRENAARLMALPHVRFTARGCEVSAVGKHIFSNQELLLRSLFEIRYRKMDQEQFGEQFSAS